MGEATHAPRTAQLLLTHLGDSHFEHASQRLMRRRFEASTGIDCTAFFKNGIFQALSAARVLEDYLGSAESARSRPGRKEFFGWPVP